jgi:hypothetical protein
MITMHHAHLMATDIAATIAFWRHGFGGEIVYDVEFAGARNVFLRIGAGHIHLYDQTPRHVGQGTVHHLGVQTDELESVVDRLHAAGLLGHRHPPRTHRRLRDGRRPRQPADRDLPTPPGNSTGRIARILRAGITAVSKELGRHQHYAHFSSMGRVRRRDVRQRR